MIINIDKIINKYRCNKVVSNYLIYQLHFPLLGIKGDNYYFADNEVLRECVENFPLWLKFINIF